MWPKNTSYGGKLPMNLQPLEDRIVVRPGVAEETTASGLVIPDTAQEKPATPLFTANTVAPKSHRAAKTYSF